MATPFLTAHRKPWTWLLTGCLALLLAGAVQAQTEPPGRVARLSVPDGAPMVQWAPAGTDDWQSAEANWPLTRGDRLRVPPTGRAELHTGGAALRLQGPAQLDISDLDDDTLRVTLVDGSLNLTVRELAPNERVEVGTRNLAFMATQPGEYRLDVDSGADVTRALVRAGAATVYGEGGQVQPLPALQQLHYTGRQLQTAGTQSAGGRDALDQWTADRNLAEDRSVSAQYLPRDAIGYQDLDGYGQWASDVEYGNIWYPSVTVVNWAPYRYGQWRWISPWGWTWIDDAPWGFAPFHYGRWVQRGPRWGWVPGPLGRRPVYSPALVGFEGLPLRPGSGRPHHPGAAWFPLAPGEPWRPPFIGNRTYLDRINRGLPPPPPRFRYAQRPDAITSAPIREPNGREAWHGRDPRQEWLRRPDRPNRPGMPGPTFGTAGPGPTFGGANAGPSFRPAGPQPSFGDPARSPAEQELRARQQQEAMQARERAERETHHRRRLEDAARGSVRLQQQQQQLQHQQEQQQRQIRDLQERQQRQLSEQREQNLRMQREQRMPRQDDLRRAAPPRMALPERRGDRP